MILSRNSYGKSAVRLVQVRRLADRHELKEITVDVRFEGEYDSVHISGDNAPVLPTDTMKNTVYALAKREPVTEVERFALSLGRHFVRDDPHVVQARVEITEHGWARLDVAGAPHRHTFTREGPERRVARVEVTRDSASVFAGIKDLVVLKTTGSGFEGYRRDTYTTLAETSDRILATQLSAHWRYDSTDLDWNASHAGAREALLECFAEHASRSVQHTLYAMGAAVLERVPEVSEVHLTMPNKHHLLVDLERFGLANENEIFVPTDEPHGMIEGTVVRSPVV